MTPAGGSGSQSCTTCQQPLTYIEQYRSWYCYVCRRYEQPSTAEESGSVSQRCPTCGGHLSFIEPYQSWYCYSCRQYVQDSESGQPTGVTVMGLTAASLFYKSNEEIRQEMFRFVRFLKKQGVTVILLAESLDQAGEQSRFGIEAFLGDSFLAIGYEKIQGEFRRTLTVLKMRFTDHDSAVHPFLLTSKGIEVSTETEVR